MARAGNDANAVADQCLRRDVAVRGTWPCAHGEVELTAAQRRKNGIHQSFDDREPQARPRLAHAADGHRHQAGGEAGTDPDGHVTFDGAPQIGQFRFCMTHLRTDHAGVLGQGIAEHRRDDAERGAVEELDGEVFLQLAQALRERRLGQEQGLGSLTDAFHVIDR